MLCQLADTTLHAGTAQQRMKHCSGVLEVVAHAKQPTAVYKAVGTRLVRQSRPPLEGAGHASLGTLISQGRAM